jgi:membrane peptidoglycan carboxypeptidase
VQLDFAFPFLERCTVVADDPRLDLAALSGPYRHRFVDDDGRTQERVMAPGAPGYVSLHEVPWVARAFSVLEDRRFWDHDGFDREQIEGAFWHNLVQGRVSRGASTISQQAARNLWLGVDRSWGRKLQEALLTARLEASTDKARIMELYLNVIELGPGTHGVDEAAWLYFGKPAAKLSVLQAIHLAALAPAPRRFAERFVDGQVDADWMDMLREHVRRLRRAGHIGDAALYEALHDELGLLDRR